jgi:hypothetical protein
MCIYVYLKIIAMNQMVLLFALGGHQHYFVNYEDVYLVLLTYTLPSVTSPKAKAVPGD